jgi:hypothetical protein
LTVAEGMLPTGIGCRFISGPFTGNSVHIMLTFTKQQ